MLQADHPREAFAAVKRAAGPRMQVRKIEIGRDEMSVLAFDPDMPEWRHTSGTRSHPGHRYSANGVREESWRVSYWTAFGHDWYRVKGPTDEGIGQEREGPAFDLLPADFIELPELSRNAAPDPKLPSSPCRWQLIDGERWWTVCIDRQGDPILVFLQSRQDHR